MDTENQQVHGSRHVDEPPHLSVPDVTWCKQAGLRSLYLRMPILMLCATINGYDGSLLNGLQTIENWRACMFPWHRGSSSSQSVLHMLMTSLADFGHPSGYTLGLFTALSTLVASAPCSSVGYHHGSD
jgi:hypothetical protein